MPVLPVNFIFGTFGPDNLTGTAGTDVIFALSGNDIIDSGAGNDLVFAGRGDDEMMWSSGDGNDTYFGGRGHDTASVETDGGLNVSFGRWGTRFSEDGDSLSAYDVEIVKIELTSGGTVTFEGRLDRSEVEAIHVGGSADADTIDASATSGKSHKATGIEAFGEDGDDTFLSGAGDDFFDGGAGTDNAVYSGNAADYDVSIKNGIVTVRDINRRDADGDRGTDTFDAVERLEFADKTILVVGGNEYASIEDAVNAASDGDIILVSDETVALSTLADPTPGQVVIDKDLTIIGADPAKSKIEAVADTVNDGGDGRGMFLVAAGVELNVSDVAIDGAGFEIFQAFRMFGSGEFDNVAFNDIAFDQYFGTAIAVIGTGATAAHVDVTNSEFSEIGRIGVQWFGPNASGTYSGNTYTGKGVGDFLDYAVEAGSGAQVEVTGGNLIRDVSGQALVDGSFSAGILVSTFFGPGTSVEIEETTVENSLLGVAIGFDANDTSAVDFGNDVDVSNTSALGVLVRGNAVVTDTREVDGTFEWFAGDGQNTVTGANDDDLLLGGDNNDDLRGFQGNDRIGGEGGNDELRGNRGEDLLSGGSGNDILRGGRDNDSLFGDGDMDELFGGRGDDILNGGDGDGADDLLTGNQGSDVFAFTSAAAPNDFGNDRILDWQDGQDYIAFDVDMAGELISAATVGADFVFDFGTYSVTVVGAGGQTFTQGAQGTGADFDFIVT